jgi:hypothetical protein
MDIGKCLKDAWGLFKVDLGPLVITALVAGAIVDVASLIVRLIVGGGLAAARFGSFGAGIGAVTAVFATVVLALISVIVYSWMLAVVTRMILRRVREHRPAEYSDMNGFDELLTFMVAYLVLGVIVVVGWAILVIPGVIVTTLWIFAPPLIVDRKLSLGEAMGESQRMAAAPSYVTTFITWFVGAMVVGILVFVLRLVPIVGIIVGLLAVPFAVAYVVSMYFQSIGQGHLIGAALGQ